MQEATIKILTPQTSNGLLNIIGEDGQLVFRESIVPAGQRKFFEKLNAQLPDNLKHRIVDNVPPPSGAQIIPDAALTDKPVVTAETKPRS